MPASYHEGNRHFQDRFDTRRLADRIDERLVRDTIDDDDRAFIERMDMFFLATADAEGSPNCSYKGGDPASSACSTGTRSPFQLRRKWHVPLDGKCAANPRVGLLFIDFERGKRMRLNGVASIDERDPLLAEYPEAQLVVRVRATEVFPNCPRYIHRMRLVERSRFVPHVECETPIPSWKRRDWSHDVLASDDPANDPTREPIDR